jgi:folate-dependent phosphoribosylglycinamide formyltransferase PurN
VRVVLCTSGGAHGAAVLARLRAAPGIELAGLVRSTRILGLRDGLLRGAYRHWRRSGAAYTLYLARSALGRVRLQPAHRTRDINDAESLAFLRGLAPELLVSAWFNQRIGEAAIAAATLGAVNIHPSLLPAYRGVDPIFHARLRGEARIGVTLHRVSPELDRGNILAQAEVAAPPDESVLRTTTRLFVRGAELLAESLGRIAARDPGTPQPEVGGYDSWPNRVQVTCALEGGIRLI